jgi:hypothetical protein
MGDFGDILDMFSNNDEKDANKNKKDNANNEATGNDIKSQLLAKISQNKDLLVSVIVAGSAVLGLAAFTESSL